MPTQDQAEYFRKRASDFRKNAEKARDVHIRRVHLEFAKKYEEAAAMARHSSARKTETSALES